MFVNVNFIKMKFYKKVVKKLFIGIFVNMHPEPILTTHERFELWLRKAIFAVFLVSYVKEKLSRINQIYYWWLFRMTHEHYNYLQLKQSLIKWKLITKDNKGTSLIKCGSLLKSSSFR
jgi:hypothetical protein